MQKLLFENAGTPLLWGVFAGIVPLLLALDLGFLFKKQQLVSFKKAAIWTCTWICVAALYAGLIAWQVNTETALAFTAGYLLEQSLSIDNVFVFILIFRAFAVPLQYHHRVLFWGVMGAFVLRGIFVIAGTALIRSFDWVLYFFGMLLLVAGVRLALQKHDSLHPTENWVVRFFRRFIPIADDYHGQLFFVRAPHLMATPLLMVLVVIETTDLVFAVDSVPAVFAVTQDPFVVYTSNIFAILGLRSLYFVVAGMMERFRYLKMGLSLVLVFVGIKLLIAKIYHIPILVSLLVLGVIIGTSVLLSLIMTMHEKRSASGRPIKPTQLDEGL